MQNYTPFLWLFVKKVADLFGGAANYNYICTQIRLYRIWQNNTAHLVFDYTSCLLSHRPGSEPSRGIF